MMLIFALQEAWTINHFVSDRVFLVVRMDGIQFCFVRFGFYLPSWIIHGVLRPVLSLLQTISGDSEL
jgi:hypothetical protein